MRAIERIIGKKFLPGEIPTGQQICEKQLIKVIDDLEKVEVNEEEIANFMPEIYRKLEWLSKEDLIKRIIGSPNTIITVRTYNNLQRKVAENAAVAVKDVEIVKVAAEKQLPDSPAYSSISERWTTSSRTN